MTEIESPFPKDQNKKKPIGVLADAYASDLIAMSKAVGGPAFSHDALATIISQVLAWWEAQK